MDVNQELLRKQIMVNQFCHQVGCAPEQATEILQAARWQIEVAYSIFFQGHAVTVPSGPHHHDSTVGSSNSDSGSGGHSFSRITPYTCVPTNTPATPPSLPDTLAAFAQMKASSPDQRGGFEPRIVHVQKS